MTPIQLSALLVELLTLPAETDWVVRACYQHACLCLVTGSRMTNSSMRRRFGIEEHNAAKASRIIAEALMPT